MVKFDESQGRWAFNDSEGISIGDNIKLETIEKGQSYKAHIIGGYRWDIDTYNNITELEVYYSGKNEYYGKPVYVPSSVKEIHIIREKNDVWLQRNLINLSEINKNLSFWVDEQNEVFSSDTCGSLYKKNKTELVHFCLGSDDRYEFEISGIRTILPESICNLRCSKLILPETLVSIKSKAISGEISEIIFKGQVQEIEEKPLPQEEDSNDEISI